MATIFAAFGKTVGNNKGSFQNFGIVGITIASEELTKFIFFYCPCDYPANKIYGSIFMWGPAAMLLIVGYLANRRTWRLTTGLCNRTQGVGKGGKRIFHFIFIFLSIGVKAIIAPATWLVLAFLKGDYYACAKWPNPDDPDEVRARYRLKPSNKSLPLPCMFNSNPIKFDGSEAEVIARNLRAESHAIGWFYVSIGMLFGVVMMFYMQCRSKYSYEQNNYIDRYRKNEVELFEDELDKKAKEQAQRIVNGYFTQPRAKEEWDQIAVINDKVTRSKRGRAIYSPLHKFVNKELRAKEDAEDVGLVSDAAMKRHPRLGVKKGKTAGDKTGGYEDAATMQHQNPPGVKNEKTASSNTGGALIPMTTIVTTGGKSKNLLKNKSPEMKTDTFVNTVDETKSDSQIKPQPTVSKDSTQMTPEVSIIQPSSSKDPVSVGDRQTSDGQEKNEPSSSDSKTPLDRQKQPVPAESGNISAPEAAHALNTNNNNASPGVGEATSEVEPNVIPPAIPPPPQVKKVAASSEPTSDHVAETSEDVSPAITETSLGDFGGSISREDLAVEDNSSDDEKRGTIVFEGQDLPEGLEDMDGDRKHDGYEPLLENGDERPLLSDDEN